MQRSIGLGFLAIWLLLTPAGGGPGGTVQAAPDTEGATRLSRLQGAASLGRNRHVVGATVLIRRSDEPSRFYVTASDSKGRFRVDGLPDGEYRLEVRREGLSTVVKDDVDLRFPSRAVIEVTMRPVDAAPDAMPRPTTGESLGSVPRIVVHGEVIERDGQAMPEVELRFVRTDGRADPIVARTGGDGSFELPQLPTGRWRLDTRVVGFLPIWVGMDFQVDTRLTVSMVPQPAGYDPSPLELMPPEQPVPPERFRAPRPTEPVEEPEEATAEESQEDPEPPTLEPTDS
jgi:hypothetical protein